MRIESDQNFENWGLKIAKISTLDWYTIESPYRTIEVWDFYSEEYKCENLTDQLQKVNKMLGIVAVFSSKPFENIYICKNKINFWFEYVQSFFFEKKSI